MCWNGVMRRTDPENTSRSYFRTGDRFFSLNGQWFFTAREGEVGPFQCREMAVEEASRYVREQEALARCVHDDLTLVPKDDRPGLTPNHHMPRANRR